MPFIFIFVSVFFLISQSMRCSDKEQTISWEISIQQKKDHFEKESRRIEKFLKSGKKLIPKKTEDYTHQDARMRYKYQTDLLQHMGKSDYRGPRFCVEQDHCLTVVPDVGLYAKNLQQFESMKDVDFIKKWPEFKEKHKEVSSYFYGDIIKKYDDRVSIKKCEKITHNTSNSMKSLWKDGIKLVQENNIEKAGPLLSKIINKVLSKGIGKEHHNLILGKIKDIIQNKSAIILPERDFLYVCSRIIRHNNGEDTSFRLNDKLCATGHLKSLLLKITSPSFDPSSYYRKGPMTFDNFYKLCDDDPAAKAAVVSSIKNHLASNPYSFPFLLIVLPFDEGKYSKDFLNSFFKSEKNIQAVKTYNVFLSNSYFKLHQKLSDSIEFNSPNKPYEIFLQKAIKFIDASPNKEETLKDEGRIKQLKEVVNDFIVYKKKILEDKLSNQTLLLWVDNFNYYMINALQSAELSEIANTLLDLDSKATALKDGFNGKQSVDVIMPKYFKDLKANFFTHNIALLGLAVQNTVKHKTIVQDLKNYLRPLVQNFLFNGSKSCFSGCIISPIACFSHDFFKIRDIIIYKDHSEWAGLIKKMEQTPSASLVCAVLGTDIIDYVKFKDKNVSLEAHFEEMASLLQMNVNDIYSIDFHHAQRLFFEKALLSMYFLSEYNNLLRSLLKPKINVIIDNIKKKVGLDNDIKDYDNFIYHSTSLGSVLRGAPLDNIKKIINKKISENKIKNKKK